MEYKVHFSNNANKQYQKLISSGRTQLFNKTKETIKKLQNKIFTPSMTAHPLKGDKKGLWDVHVKGNFVITYKYNEVNKLLIINSIGNHEESDLESYNDFTREEKQFFLKYVI